MPDAGLVAVAKGRSLEAVHVTWLNLEGAADRRLASLAAERDYVIVTNNRRDFVRLYAQMEIHNGIIIIVPLGKRAERCRLFTLALDAVQAEPSLVNLLVEVHADGSVEVRNWTKAAG